MDKTNENSFFLDTSIMIPREYWVEIKGKTHNEEIFYKDLIKFEIVSKPFKLVKASLFLIPIPFPSISCPILKLLKLTREVNLGLSLMSIPIGVETFTRMKDVISRIKE